jgi:hypothetical protein
MKALVKSFFFFYGDFLDAGAIVFVPPNDESRRRTHKTNL